MRILGYPPGWLKEADMSKTVVSIIDDSQKEVSAPVVDKSKCLLHRHHLNCISSFRHVEC